MDREVGTGQVWSGLRRGDESRPKGSIYCGQSGYRLRLTLADGAVYHLAVKNWRCRVRCQVQVAFIARYDHFHAFNLYMIDTHCHSSAIELHKHDAEVENFAADRTRRQIHLM